MSRATYNYLENGTADLSRDDLKNIVSDFGLDEKEETALYRANAQVPSEIDNLNLPFPRNPFFTGREAQLEQLRQYLQVTGSVALTQPVSVSGLGGIGKTQLALEYAYRWYPEVYRTVLWVSAADEQALQAGYDELAHRLKLPGRYEQEVKTRIQAVKLWLKEHTNWLLIMDNADDLQLARSFFPECKHGHILLTTRSPFAGEIGARPLEIDKMEPEVGRLFLLKRTRMLEDETALELVKLLDGLPLALDQAGAYIEETRVSFAGYIDLYREARSRLLSSWGPLKDKNEGKYSDHPESVIVTFGLCFTKARELHPLAKDILHFCAFLQPDAIPEELFQHDDSFKLDTFAFNGGIAALHRYSLIKRNTQEQTLSIHRLVQAVLIDDMPPDVQNQWRERLVRTLNAAFPDFEYSNSRLLHLLPYFSFWEMWAKDVLTLTIGEADLLHLAGLSLRARGQHSVAELILEAVVSIYFGHLGAKHPNTVYALTNLAVLKIVQGKTEQLDPEYLQGLTILGEQLDAEHPFTAKCLHNLGCIYLGQGEYEKAEPLLVRALSIQKTQLGAEHPDIAKSLHNLAVLYSWQGNYSQAEPLFQKALAIRKQHFGAEHPSTTVTLDSLACLYHEQGRHEQAETLYQSSRVTPSSTTTSR